MAATKKRKRLTKIGKYDITPLKGRKGGFRGTLLKTLNVGSNRIAIFSVPKKK